jgi:tetratricopeptide (TPR) repeat protein
LENPASAGDLARGRFFVALYRRDPAAADRGLAAVGDGTLQGRGIGAVELNRAYAQGLVARMKGDAAGARAAFIAARSEQDNIVRADPDDASKLCALALIDAELEQKEEALREGRRTVELLPVAKDAINGAEVLYFYAVVCAWVGERDRAIEQLEILAKSPPEYPMGRSVSIRFGTRYAAIRASRKSSPRSRQSRSFRTPKGECAGANKSNAPMTVGGCISAIPLSKDG